MTPRLSPGDRLRRAMNDALAQAGAELGQTLEWTPQEQVTLDRAALAADRAEDLRARYREELDGASKASSLTRLSSEIRMLDRQVVDLVSRLNVGVGPAKSERHVRAVDARWKRQRASRA